LFLILTTEPFSVTLGDTFERVTPQSPLLWDHVTEMFQSKKPADAYAERALPGAICMLLAAESLEYWRIGIGIHRATGD
jgi:hypothetical protein